MAGGAPEQAPARGPAAATATARRTRPAAERRGEESRSSGLRAEPCVLIQVRSMWCFLIAPLRLRLYRGPWAVGCGLWAALRTMDAGKDARALARALGRVPERSRGMTVKHHGHTPVAFLSSSCETSMPWKRTRRKEKRWALLAKEWRKLW